MKKIFIINYDNLLFVAGCGNNSNTIEMSDFGMLKIFLIWKMIHVKNDDEFSLGGRKLVTQEILDMKLDHMTEVISPT